MRSRSPVSKRKQENCFASIIWGFAVRFAAVYPHVQRAENLVKLRRSWLCSMACCTTGVYGYETGISSGSCCGSWYQFNGT
jgi:hypothetical protein